MSRRSSTYLWNPYIPFGEVTAIGGIGESGKTWLVVKIIAEMTASDGGKMPKNPKRAKGRATTVKPAKAIIIQRENDEGAVLLPRIEALGGDPAEVLLPAEQFAFGPGDTQADLEDFCRLAYYIIASGAKLTFFDPLTAYINGNMKDAQEMRRVLERLQAVARFTDSAIMYVLHLNKNYEAPIETRLMYSVEFYNTPRSVMFLSRDPEGEDTESVVDFKLWHSKLNIAPKGGPMGFRLDGNLEDDGRISFVWRDTDQDEDINTAMAAQASSQSDGRTKHGQVRDALLKELFAADRIVAITVLKDNIAEELGWEITKIIWERAKKPLPFGPIEIRKNQDTGIFEEEKGSGIWGYRPLGLVGDDEIARLLEGSDEF